MLTACFVLVSFVLLQTDSKPVPDVESFLAEFRKTLHTDNVLLSQYTYTEKRSHTELDSNGKPKKTDVEVYEITRGSEPASLYRRLVEKNGAAVRSAKPEKVRRAGPRDDEKVIDDLFGVYEMEIIGREEVDGRPALQLSFKPRAAYKPKTRQGSFMQHVAGQAWISEIDHQLVRVDAQVVDTISIGFGLLARLQKGARIYAERKKINNEIWLPARTEATVSARVLLLKGINIREIFEYSDYKKFNVETILKFPDTEKD